MPSRLIPLGFLATAAAALAAEPAMPAKISFNRDIRPIMSDTCFHCHGFDPKTREAGLRLDLREEAVKTTENDIVGIVPGKPEQSEIISRILDEDDPMPPEKAHKPLTERQKALFKQWVAEGAVYEPHWAYSPLVKPPVKQGAQPVDFFVQGKLAEKGISPSPEAPKAKLLRRLTLDLTGLPPTPEEVATFEQDTAPDAYSRQAQRLLASPHYGERMAVWWLDIARYADTVGFHGDQNQRIFPYRDYVIQAFNTNKRFDAFTREQLAGDLLPNPSPEQLVATGYNRLNMMTREGGAQPKEYLAKYGAERVRSVAAAWFGSTFGCAECHDHKFDPIKTRDFYELQAFFADVKQWGVYADYGYTPNPELAGMNNDYPFPPEILVDSPYQKNQLKRRQEELTQHLTSRLSTANRKSQKGWLAEMKAFLTKHEDGWARPKAISAVITQNGKPDSKRKPVLAADDSVKVDKVLGKSQALEITLPCQDLTRLAAIRVEVLDDGKATQKPTPLNMKMSLQRANGKKQGLSSSLADASLKAPDYSGGTEKTGISSGWLIPQKPNGKPMVGIVVLDTPQTCTAEDKLVLSFTGTTEKALRISLSPLATLDPLQTASPVVVQALLSGKPSSLADQTWYVSTGSDAAGLKRAREMQLEISRLNQGRAWSMVTESTTPLKVRVLPRGNFMDETGDVVLPSTPSFLPGRRESTEQKRLTRLDLANWITSAENPITARAVMNRLWQQFFGIGLSAAVDDLGSQGELPSHPELLDWLASEFRESGWDMKHMIQLIVTSHTYRQSSSLRPELKEADPANRLLASQNPRRLEAEFVRDNALAIAGVLNLADIGGPSSKPYQPPGYYAALQFPSRDYEAANDETQWRRGLYTHWQRTFLHPMMANFDAPARDECAALRTVSNTPQQALTLLNDPSFVEAARLLAARLLSEPQQTDAERISRACELTWARDPKAKEASSLATFLSQQRDYYKANAEDAKKLIQIGNSTSTTSDASELAAWTTLCRVLLNAQETITRY